MCDLYGYSVEEARGLHIEDLSVGITPYTQNDAVRLVRAALKEGPQLFEWHAKDRAGRLFWVEVNLKQAVIGGQLRILAVVRDITERKKAGDALSSSYSLLESTMASTADGLLVISRDGKVSFFNERFRQLWRIPAEFIAQKDDKKLMDFVMDQLSDPRAFLAKVEFLYQHPEQESFEEIRFKDGRIFERYSLPQKKNDEIIGRVWSFRDVTERKRAEKDLRESEERYRTLIETIPDVIFTISIDGKLVSLNQPFETTTGWSRQEWIGRSIQEIIHPDDVSFVMKDVAEIISGRPPTPKEVRVLTKSQKYIVGNFVTTRLIRDGKVVGLLGIGRDVTERKMMVDALKESELRFRTLVENAPDVIYSISAEDQTLLSLNPVFEKVTGWSRDEWIGKTFSSIIHPDDLELAIKTFEQALNGKVTAPYELRVRSKSGSYIVGEFISTPLIRSGKVAGELGIVRDITERRKVEDALRLTQFCVDHAGEGIAWVTRDGSYLYANDQLCKILGYSQEELRSLRVSDIDVNFSEESWREYWNRLKKAGSITFETECYMKDGAVFPVEVTANYMKFGDQELDFGFVRDISERKKIERMKDNLIRNVTHELKTPIAMTEMAYDMCARAIKANDMVRLKKAHQVAFDNIKRIRTDIDNILTSFALERRESKRRRSFSLKKLIGSVLKDDSPLLKEKKLKLKVDIPKNANKVWADSREIRILFHNVLDNAIKFTKKGSISISSRLKRDSIYVKVKDTGAGIAPDMLEKVFEPFVKESASISGTGLGLSICKEIVERNDGTIEVRSKGKERGTTVIVKLPTLR